MKTSVFAAFSALALLVSASCVKSNGPSTGSAPSPSSGLWKVVRYVDRQNDETSRYADYSFEFASSNKLTAKTASKSHFGAWATAIDDSADKLLIDFDASAPSALLEIEEDWLILKMNDETIELRHVSGGDGHVSELHFAKL